MPNTASAKKRLRQNETRRKRNQSNKSELRGLISRWHKLIKVGSLLEADKLYPYVQKTIDQAASKGIIHRNKASRQKSRCMRVLKSSQASSSPLLVVDYHRTTEIGIEITSSGFGVAIGEGVPAIQLVFGPDPLTSTLFLPLGPMDTIGRRLYKILLSELEFDAVEFLTFQPCKPDFATTEETAWYNSPSYQGHPIDSPNERLLQQAIEKQNAGDVLLVYGDAGDIRVFLSRHERTTRSSCCVIWIHEELGVTIKNLISLLIPSYATEELLRIIDSECERRIAELEEMFPEEQTTHR